MSKYENKLQNKAIAKLAEQKDVIPKDLFTQMFSDLMDKISTGTYAFGGDVCNKSLNTLSGISDLIGILCSVDSEEAMRLLIDEGESFKIAFDHIVSKSISDPDANDDQKKTETT
jgi:hypothetical protein